MVPLNTETGKAEAATQIKRNNDVEEKMWEQGTSRYGLHIRAIPLKNPPPVSSEYYTKRGGVSYKGGFS